jgi:hypothetical protein
MQDPKTGEKIETRMHVYIDPTTGKKWMFPLLREESNEFCEVAQAEDPEAKMRELNEQQEAREKLAVASDIDPEQIRRAEEALKGVRSS